MVESKKYCLRERVGLIDLVFYFSFVESQKFCQTEHSQINMLLMRLRDSLASYALRPCTAAHGWKDVNGTILRTSEDYRQCARFGCSDFNHL